MNQNYFDGVMDDVLVRTFMMPAVMPNIIILTIITICIIT